MLMTIQEGLMNSGALQVTYWISNHIGQNISTLVTDLSFWTDKYIPLKSASHDSHMFGASNTKKDNIYNKCEPTTAWVCCSTI